MKDNYGSGDPESRSGEPRKEPLLLPVFLKLRGRKVLTVGGGRVEEASSWLAAAEGLRAKWQASAVPTSDRRPLLLRALNELYGARK